MKLSLTFYGCSDYFKEKTQAHREVSLREIKRVFGTGLTRAVTKNIGIPEVEIVINEERIPIPRTFVADCALDSKGEFRNFRSERLEKIAKELGLLWMEFIRAFIDSG